MEQKAQREKDLRALEDAMAASAKANRQLEAEIGEIRTRSRQAQHGADRDGGSGARNRRPDSRPRGKAEDAGRQRIGDPTLAGQPAWRDHRGFRRLAADGPATAAGRARAAGGYAGGRSRLDPSRGGPARAAHRSRALATDLAELVRLKNAIATDRGSLEPGAVSPARSRTGVRSDRSPPGANRRNRENPGLGAGQGRRIGPASRISQRVDRPHGERNRRAPNERPTKREKPPKHRKSEAREQFAQAAFRDPARLAPKIPFFRGTRTIAAPCERRCSAGIRGIRRLWWDDSRDFDRDPPQSRHCLTGRWVGRVRRSLPVVWTTLDHQRGRRVLSVVSRNGPNQCRRRAVRARRRARRDDGRDIPRVACRK